MAEFKDISQFTVKTPDGTEEVQVSATQKVNLKTVVQKFAPSAGISLSSPLTGFVSLNDSEAYGEIKATTTLLKAIELLDNRVSGVIVDYNRLVSTPTLSIIGFMDNQPEAIINFLEPSYSDNALQIIYSTEHPSSTPDELIKASHRYMLYNPMKLGNPATIEVTNPAGNYYDLTGTRLTNLTVQRDKDFGTAIVRTTVTSMNITSTSSLIKKCEGFDDVMAKIGLKVITMFAMDATVHCNVALYQ